MANVIGTKEKQLAVLKGRNLTRAHEMMLADGAPPECLRFPEDQKPKKTEKTKPSNGGLTLATPLAIQKAIARDLADDDSVKPDAAAPVTPHADTPAQADPATQEKTMKTATKTTATRKSRPTPTAQRRKVKSTAARPTKASKPKAPKEPKGMVVDILKLSSRENGVSPTELNKLTKWKGAPWKWLFSNPKKTGYCDRWNYSFKVLDKDGETRYKTEKKA